MLPSFKATAPMRLSRKSSGISKSVWVCITKPDYINLDLESKFHPFLDVYQQIKMTHLLVQKMLTVWKNLHYKLEKRTLPEMGSAQERKFHKNFHFSSNWAIKNWVFVKNKSSKMLFLGNIGPVFLKLGKSLGILGIFPSNLTSTHYFLLTTHRK